MAAEKRSAPYAPPSNVLAVIRRYRERNLPDVIGVDLLSDMGISKGNIHRTLAGLVFLGLIDEDGTPTQMFHSLQIATDEEYRSIFEGVVRSSYREAFQSVDPSKDAQNVIDNHFRRYQPTSQRSRMVILFLGLCREAGIPTLDTPRTRSIKAKGITQRFPRGPTRSREGSIGIDAQSPMLEPTPPIVTATTVPELRTAYIAALIEQVRQSAAHGKDVDNELLERIERLIEASSTGSAE